MDLMVGLQQSGGEAVCHTSSVGPFAAMRINSLSSKGAAVDLIANLGW